MLPIEVVGASGWAMRADWEVPKLPRRMTPRSPMGKELGKLRIDNDETVAEMGQRLGIHPSTLRMYESGQRLPDQSFFRKIGTVYGVDLSRYYQEPHKSPTSVLGRFMMLPDADLEAIEQIFVSNRVPCPRIVLKALALKREEKSRQNNRTSPTILTDGSTPSVGSSVGTDDRILDVDGD
jgi:transcriptional regulator with XRE-family HTH domain